MSCFTEAEFTLKAESTYPVLCNMMSEYDLIPIACNMRKKKIDNLLLKAQYEGEDEQTQFKMIEELQELMANEYHANMKYLSQISNINYRLLKFDVEKTSKLPEDVLLHIQGYLDPNIIEVCRKYGVISHYLKTYSVKIIRSLYDEVNKSAIIKLIKGAKIDHLLSYKQSDSKQDIIQTLLRYIGEVEKEGKYNPLKLFLASYRVESVYKFILLWKCFVGNLRYIKNAKYEANRKQHQLQKNPIKAPK